MRIALITTGLAVGGGEMQVCNLADQFASKGHSVQILSLTGSRILSPSNKNISIIELNTRKNIFSLVSSLFKGLKEIRKFNPDIIHSHMIHANIYSRFIRIFTRIPLICTAHSTYEGSGLRTLMYRYTDFLCDLNTNVSDEGVNIYIRNKYCNNNKIIYVPNGIDSNKFKKSENSRINKRNEINLNDSDILFLSVGRLTQAKDYPNLLKAFSLLVKNNPLAKLAIIGVGELESSLLDLTKALEINDSVLFLGHRSDISEWMSAADCFVLSSAWEGLPLVLLEAMSCSLFVIATDCGGIGKLIKNRGELVPVKDNEKLFLAFKKYLLLSREEKNEITFQSREFVVNNYSLNAISDKWLSIYKNKGKF
ncbi:TPA: glycosyltransferase [Photobacterium damselae]